MRCGNRIEMGWRERRFAFTTLLALVAVLPLGATAQGIDPNLRLGIERTNQNVVLRWFASNAVPYQLEASSALMAWTNSSLVVTGKGGFLSLTNPIAGHGRDFFRVKRLVAEDLAADFDSATGILTITGDDLDNVIAVSRDAAGTLRVNGGAVVVRGGLPTVANTTLIQMFGRGGSDRLSLDETNGPLPPAQLFGEAGDDTLTGGSGPDVLNGGPGMDTLLGRGGADSLIGGDDNDVVTGGDGDDIVQLGMGNDRFVWNPGDDTDFVEGNDGTDTIEVNGGNGAEVFTATANGPRVRFDRLDPAPFFLDLGTCENLVVNANGGNDSFSATGNLATLIKITVDGGAGNDTILGSNGADVLRGGDGNDFVDGQQGDDMILLGAGDDVFQWDPGDGLDTVEGQSENDTLLFNGSNGPEIMEISANGGRLRFTRNLGTVVLDLAGIETVQCNAAGSADMITVNDLSATEVNRVSLNLASPAGGTNGDLQIDTVTVNGTSGMDQIAVIQNGAELSVLGLAALITISGGETNDVLIIKGLADNDTIDASAVASLFALTLDGGEGRDTLRGGQGNDQLMGGDGNDFVDGNRGNDTALLGAGDDVFQWDPGDGNDTVEGQADVDTWLFNGASIPENMELVANGGRILVVRDLGNVTLNGDDLEKIEVNLTGGADNLTVGELTSTDLKDLTLNLAASGGAGDAEAAAVFVNGQQTNDSITVSGAAGRVTVTGLAATLTIVGAAGANDRLTINALAGDDSVDASGLAAGVMGLTLNGGLGVDVMIGSQGGDIFAGGDGNDSMFGGDGNDTFVWNPGDDNDTVEGQAGTDTLVFNGAVISERIELTAVGGRLRFTRDIALVAMDCAGVELVQVNVLGGADTITVGPLAGTGVTGVNVALGATLGSTAGDNQPDNIIIQGTATNDTVIVRGSFIGVSVSGLLPTVTVTGSEPANDRITINALAGDDTVNASGLGAGFISLTANGGLDDDLLIGSAGIDILFGDEGDDVLMGGPGFDILDGGPGNNIVVQD